MSTEILQQISNQIEDILDIEIIKCFLFSKY